MTPPRSLTAVPRAWPVRAEIIKAARTLVAQVAEEEEQQKRRSEPAAASLVDEFVAAMRELRAELCQMSRQELRKAGFNPSEPRVPAGSSDGGQWTSGAGGALINHPRIVSDAAPDNTWIPGAQYAANDPPGIGHNQGPPLGEPPEIPRLRPSKMQLINNFLKIAAYWLAASIAASKNSARFRAALLGTQWLAQEFLPSIISYLDAPKTWDELQQDALSGRRGYDIHHPVEQTPARRDGFPESMVDGPDNRLSIPRLKHWQINGWYGTKNDDYGSLSPRDYLRGKSWDERARVGRDALVRFGVLKP